MNNPLIPERYAKQILAARTSTVGISDFLYGGSYQLTPPINRARLVIPVPSPVDVICQEAVDNHARKLVQDGLRRVEQRQWEQNHGWDRRN